jgi:dipeptidyl aminopeptidase/acylaminoacyl peptidase
VNTLEERLRDAYRAAADTVRPEAVLPSAILSPPGRARRRPGRSPSRRRPLIPLAAAAAVIAVAAAVAVLLPRAAPGLGRGHPADGLATPVPPTTPAFFVEMNWSQTPSMYVANATTGAQGAQISLPFPAADLTSVATGDGQTFVVAATAQGSCSTTLYRFSLAANGTPGAMTAFTKVAGQISDPWDMAVSAGSQFIAYQTMACNHLSPEQFVKAAKDGQTQRGYLSVLNTVTGQTKQWTYQTKLDEFLPATGNVSISANGSVVGFSNEVIDTDAAPGSLAAHARVVATDGEFGPSVNFNIRNSPDSKTMSGPSVVIGGLNVSPDGKTVYFATFKEDKSDKPVWSSWQLRAFDLATGQTRLVRSFPGTEGSPAAVTFDPTGRYMVVEYIVRTGPTTKLALIDTATGQLTLLNASWAVDPAIAW